jgi:hypothetical protein
MMDYEKNLPALIFICCAEFYFQCSAFHKSRVTFGISVIMRVDLIAEFRLR